MLCPYCKKIHMYKHTAYRCEKYLMDDRVLTYNIIANVASGKKLYENVEIRKRLKVFENFVERLPE